MADSWSNCGIANSWTTPEKCQRRGEGNYHVPSSNDDKNFFFLLCKSYVCTSWINILMNWDPLRRIEEAFGSQTPAASSLQNTRRVKQASNPSCSKQWVSMHPPPPAGMGDWELASVACNSTLMVWRKNAHTMSGLFSIDHCLFSVVSLRNLVINLHPEVSVSETDSIFLAVLFEE